MKTALSFALLFAFTAALSQTDLNVDGNLQLNRQRSTIFTQGEYFSTHRGGIQFLTFDNGNTFVFQPTNAQGTAVNSTLRLGGFGSFSTNTVGLAVSGKAGIGTASPEATFAVFTPASSSFIAGLNVDMQSFGTYNNAVASHYLRLRDVGGNATAFIVKGTGFVGINTATPDAYLTVNGDVHAREVRVDLNTPGPDYVFDENYSLPPLSTVREFIKKNHHLPDVPKAAEMEEAGINLGNMDMILLKKIEELTLYVLEQQEEIKRQNLKIEELQAKVK